MLGSSESIPEFIRKMVGHPIPFRYDTRISEKGIIHGIRNKFIILVNPHNCKIRVKKKDGGYLVQESRRVLLATVAHECDHYLTRKAYGCIDKDWTIELKELYYNGHI